MTSKVRSKSEFSYFNRAMDLHAASKISMLSANKANGPSALDSVTDICKYAIS